MTTFYEFQKQFPDDEACLEHLMQTRCGGTEINCPKCGVFSKFYRMTRERAYVCQHCKHQLHPTVGTIMHRTHLPLHYWFFAIYLFTTSRHGVPAKELDRRLGLGSYRTAWRMAHKIREHMAETDGELPLGGPGGDVEVDETYVGGKAKGKGRGYKGNKTVVMAMAERDGDVMAKVVPNVRKKTLLPIISANVELGSTVHTDELRSYLRLAEAGYSHASVNHSAGEYVNDNSHVNSVEGFWSRVKNSIRGTHVHVSGKYLQKYVKEFEYRYNRRKRPTSMFGELVATL